MELKFVFIPVPVELIEESEIDLQKVLQFTTHDGKVVIENADDTDFECDGDCESCPLFKEDCDGNCENCHCYEVCDESEVLSNE